MGTRRSSIGETVEEITSAKRYSNTFLARIFAI
jgi:hypothetical protein